MVGRAGPRGGPQCSTAPEIQAEPRERVRRAAQQKPGRQGCVNPTGRLSRAAGAAAEVPALPSSPEQLPSPQDNGEEGKGPRRRQAGFWRPALHCKRKRVPTSGPCSCPSLSQLRQQRPKLTRWVGQEAGSALLGEMGQQLHPASFPPHLGGWGSCRGQAEILRFRGTFWLGCMALAVSPQQLQPSLRSVTLSCQDANLSMLLPVLNLALPAGK